jgi:hypothetical protein
MGYFASRESKQRQLRQQSFGLNNKLLNVSLGKKTFKGSTPSNLKITDKKSPKKIY